ANPRKAGAVAQLGSARHRRTVDGYDEIVVRQPGAFGGRSGLDPGDHRALRALGTQRLSDVGGKILDRDANAAALDLTIRDQLVHDLAGHADRDRKADADIAASRCQDRGVDADNPALQIDERPAGIARVDRGVGLNEILIAFDTKTAPERADDPGSHGLAEAKRIADREDEIADLQSIRIAHRHR